MSEPGRITIPLRKWAIALGVMVALLTVLGVFAEYTRYFVDRDSEFVDYFSLTEEQNVPTWWSSLLLAACAVTVSFIAATTPRAPRRFKGHWALLSAIFCYMSIDEFVEIHEWLNSIEAFDNRSGFLHYGWVIPAGVLVAVFALSYLKFLFHLPPKTRIAVALAGLLFVGGAVGTELILGAWTDAHGESNFTWAAIGAVQESMEMMGSSLFLVAMLRYLGSSDLEVRFDGR